MYVWSGQSYPFPQLEHILDWLLAVSRPLTSLSFLRRLTLENMSMNTFEMYVSLPKLLASLTAQKCCSQAPRGFHLLKCKQRKIASLPLPVWMGRQEPNFCGHPSYKTTSRHEDKINFTFLLSKANHQTRWFRILPV